MVLYWMRDKQYLFAFLVFLCKFLFNCVTVTSKGLIFIILSVAGVSLPKFNKRSDCEGQYSASPTQDVCNCAMCKAMENKNL